MATFIDVTNSRFPNNQYPLENLVILGNSFATCFHHSATTRALHVLTHRNRLALETTEAENVLAMVTVHG
jgi:hypothetical protein